MGTGDSIRRGVLAWVLMPAGAPRERHHLQSRTSAVTYTVYTSNRVANPAPRTQPNLRRDPLFDELHKVRRPSERRMRGVLRVGLNRLRVNRIHGNLSRRGSPARLLFVVVHSTQRDARTTETSVYVPLGAFDDIVEVAIFTS